MSWTSGAAAEAAVPGAETAASSDEFKEESSGFAIRRPPNDCERLRSPSMMGKETQLGTGKREERGGRGRERERGRERGEGDGSLVIEREDRSPKAEKKP